MHDMQFTCNRMHAPTCIHSAALPDRIPVKFQEFTVPLQMYIRSLIYSFIYHCLIFFHITVLICKEIKKKNNYTIIILNN